MMRLGKLPFYCIPESLVPQRHIQLAKELFLKGPVKLSDQFGNGGQLQGRVKGLPEMLFVGSTNVGKSSLLSSLLAPQGAPPATAKKPRDLPNTSKRQGYTRTLSFYNVGNKLRLVDTPGYGFRSNNDQGSVMQDYLEEHAQNLVKAYILVAAAKGITEKDADVVRMLHHYGIPFNFVVTKADVFKDVPELEKQCNAIYRDVNELGNELLAVPGDMYITSTARRKWPLLGISHLRGAIYQSSGLIEAELLRPDRRP